MSETTVYQKLHEARKFIRTLDAKKEGKNKHFNFNYFTPEQVSQLVSQACEDQKLLPLFSLKKNEFGHYGVLIVQDLDSNQHIDFEMSTGIPEIRAANIAQQLGGTVTYTERYLNMTAFDIKDNNLDPDTTMGSDQKTQESAPEPETWLNKWTSEDRKTIRPDYLGIVKHAKDNKLKVADLRKHYKISKLIASELEKDLK